MKPKPNNNIYRQAKQLLDKKDAGGKINWDEFHLINTAILPLLTLRRYNSMPIAQGLEELAQIVEEARTVT